MTTPFVAFLDADVTAPPEWIEPLLAHFADPTVGAVAPRVRGEQGSPLDLGNDEQPVGVLLQRRQVQYVH